VEVSHSDQLSYEVVHGGSHVSKVPSFVDHGGGSLDVAASCVMFDVRNIGGLLQGSQLDWPDGFLDRPVELVVALALPECLDYVFHTDDALLSEQLFNEHVVRDGDSFELLLEVTTLSDDLFEDHLGGGAPADVVLDEQKLLEVVVAGSHESTVVDLFESEFLENLLCLRRGVSGLFDSDDEYQTVDWDSLLLGQDHNLLILDHNGVSSLVLGVVAGLESLVLHVVPLLLHVVRDVDFRHGDLGATGDGQLIICFLLADLSHLLPGPVVLFSLLDEIVALSLL